MHKVSIKLHFRTFGHFPPSSQDTPNASGGKKGICNRGGLWLGPIFSRTDRLFVVHCFLIIKHQIIILKKLQLLYKFSCSTSHMNPNVTINRL